jgi:hypothetical protein
VGTGGTFEEPCMWSLSRTSVESIWGVGATGVFDTGGRSGIVSRSSGSSGAGVVSGRCSLTSIGRFVRCGGVLAPSTSVQMSGPWFTNGGSCSRVRVGAGVTSISCSGAKRYSSDARVSSSRAISSGSGSINLSFRTVGRTGRLS